MILSKYFKSSASLNFVTEKCEAVSFKLDDSKCLFVDTPGLCDINHTDKEILNEIEKALDFCKPGPHCFVIVIACQRLTYEGKKCIENILKIFGRKKKFFFYI